MKTPTLTPEQKQTVLGDAPLHAQCHPERRYTVVRTQLGRPDFVVGEHLAWDAAKRLADTLDNEYRLSVLNSGRIYSAWRADLHECRLEKGGV